jgi:hypothetical protein
VRDKVIVIRVSTKTLPALDFVMLGRPFQATQHTGN